MIKSTYIAAFIAAALCIGSTDAFAGSTQPNPKALAKTATEELAVNREIQGFLTKLADGGEYTTQFDAAAFAKDKKRLVALIRQAGVKTREVSIGDITPDIKITIRINRVTIIIKW